VTDAAATDDSGNGKLLRQNGCTGGGVMTCHRDFARLPTLCQPSSGEIWQPHPYYWDIQTRSPAVDCGKVDHTIINHQQVGQDHYLTHICIHFLGSAADKHRQHVAHPLLSPTDKLPVISRRTGSLVHGYKACFCVEPLTGNDPSQRAEVYWHSLLLINYPSLSR